GLTTNKSGVNQQFFWHFCQPAYHRRLCFLRDSSPCRNSHPFALTRDRHRALNLNLTIYTESATGVQENESMASKAGFLDLEQILSASRSRDNEACGCC